MNKSAKLINISCYGRNQSVEAQVYRADKESDLPGLIQLSAEHGVIARGAGLSYGDVCLNQQVIDCTRLTHLISLEKHVIAAQAGVRLQDLLRIAKDLSLAVIPGTLGATLAGAIANDVHGKNNPKQGCFGHAIEWIELCLPDGPLTVSPENHRELFYATIGGLGLTGIISRAGVKLINNTKVVSLSNKAYAELPELMQSLIEDDSDYAVAWLDLLNKPRAILSRANHSQQEISLADNKTSIPFVMPVSLVNRWGMKCFNHLYYQLNKEKRQTCDVISFNNPLDKVANWDYLYGKKGMLQFQCLFPFENAYQCFQNINTIIKKHGAPPMLSVLKKFTQKGLGLLSFAEPGFTLAMDFLHKPCAIAAIKELNEFLLECGGKVYLAKDNYLSAQQFEGMYQNVEEFKKILTQYQCQHYFQSKLSRRLGIS